MANRAALIRAENAGLAVTGRGRNHIEFDAGNGRRRQVVTIDPLHVAGTETEIDTAWQPATGAWQHEMTLADFQAHARSVFNAGGLLEFRIGEEWVIFDPQSINWTNQDNSRQQIAIKQTVTGIVEDDVLRFPAGYGAGRHFQYQNQSRQLQKLITIDSLANLPAPTVTGTVWFEAEFTISTSAGVDFYLDGARWAKVNNARVKTANRIEIRDAATGTNVLWLIDFPRAWDSADNQTIGEFEVRRQGGASNLFITVRIPKTWIDTAVFPIFIDPTLSLQPDATAGIDTWIRADQATTNLGIENRMFIGELSVATVLARSLIKFDISSIPSDATIDSATLSLYSFDDRAINISDTYRAYRMKRAWVETQATWNVYSTGNSWQTAGGFGVNDCEQTGIGSLVLSDAEAAGFKDWSLDTTAVQEWVSGAFTNNGLLFKTDGELDHAYAYRTSDHTTAGERPKLVVEYTEAGGGAFTLTAEQGSYTLAGQTAALLAGRLLTAAQGSYALTGQAAGLLAGRALAAEQGSYALTGIAADLIYTPVGAFTLTAEVGNYALAGQAANLLAARLLTAAQGSYTLSGQDAGLTADRLLAAAQGGYSLTGQDAGLLAARVLAAAQGAYVLAGQDVALAHGYMLAAGQGSYTLTGQDITIILARVLLAGQGSYTLTGQAVTLTYSAAALAVLVQLTLRERSFTLTLRER